MLQGIGRTYRYYNASAPGAEPVLYPFGFGLSYTSFALAWDTTNGAPPVLPVVTSTSGSTTLMVAVSNTGSVDGDEVLQASLSTMGKGKGRVLQVRRLTMGSMRVERSLPIDSRLLRAREFDLMRLPCYSRRCSWQRPQHPWSIPRP